MSTHQLSAPRLVYHSVSKQFFWVTLLAFGAGSTSYSMNLRTFESINPNRPNAPFLAGLSANDGPGAARSATWPSRGGVTQISPDMSERSARHQAAPAPAASAKVSRPGPVYPKVIAARELAIDSGSAAGLSSQSLPFGHDQQQLTAVEAVQTAAPPVQEVALVEATKLPSPFAAGINSIDPGDVGQSNKLDRAANPLSIQTLVAPELRSPDVAGFDLAKFTPKREQLAQGTRAPSGAKLASVPGVGPAKHRSERGPQTVGGARDRTENGALIHSMSVRFGSTMAGSIDVHISDQQTPSVRLSDILSLVQPQMDAALFAALSKSPNAGEYVTFDQIRSAGIDMHYDAARDAIAFDAGQ